jgi:NADH:ubiquinone oxidoreductase subunit 3 (subunit A)
MNVNLLSPPFAFLISLLLAGLLYRLGQLMAGPGVLTDMKRSTYSSGEAPPEHGLAPGYRPFFAVALFFAILHLGVLVLGSGGITIISAVYLAGLFLALLALILG